MGFTQTFGKRLLEQSIYLIFFQRPKLSYFQARSPDHGQRRLHLVVALDVEVTRRTLQQIQRENEGIGLREAHLAAEQSRYRRGPEHRRRH